MPHRKSQLAIKLAIAAVFAALACIATMSFSIYVPATEGFFNIGESVVFLSAILFGPVVGAFAGGVGSAFADLLLGYWYYAPATAVVKACEGAVVGVLMRRAPNFSSRLYWKFFTALLGGITGLLLGWIGTVYYSGVVELTLGMDVFTLYIPAELWVSLGAIIACTVFALGFLADPEFGWTVFSVVVGGLIMVLGYFIYQQFFIFPLFEIEVIAFLEIPVNIGQMIVGATVALPVARIVWRALPSLKGKIT